MNRQYKNIDYILKLSRRKTACIQIDRNGCISVRVPNRTTIKQVEGFIEQKETWITRTLEACQERNARRVTRQYTEGETALYLGKPYPLKIISDRNIPLLLNENGFQLSTEYSEPSRAREAFIAFYREKGLHVMKPRVAHFQAIMGVEAKKIRMSNALTRWASCSSKGTLNFTWKCLMLPQFVLDYIVVHELAHLIHMNHSRHFWREVEKILPDYKQAYKWLRTKGADLSL